MATGELIERFPSLFWALLTVVAVLFVLSGLDDLFVDLLYLLRRFGRRYFASIHALPVTEYDLSLPSEKAIAVLIPAWQEAPVLRRMIENTVRIVDYSNYHVFVGTYPNDSESWREVEGTREHLDNVHRIVCPRDGPSGAADCLNWVFQGIWSFEKKRGIRFEIFVIHYAQDVLHSLSLKLFNFLIPPRGMVQLPVLPLEGSWQSFTANHYLDEFAESNFKGLEVRQWIARCFPASGSGYALSRRTCELLAESRGGQVFNNDSVAEDYELGVRLCRYEIDQFFVNLSVQRTSVNRSFWTHRLKEKTVAELIATRKLFPASLGSAIRQKSRRVLGIALQGWSQLGWVGRFWARYMLLRDRKVLLTYHVNFLFYLGLVFLAGQLAWEGWSGQDRTLSTLMKLDFRLNYLLIGAGLIVVWRLGQRSYWVQRFYSAKQALLSVPRLFWGSLINSVAAARSTWQYLRFATTGKEIGWERTERAFPLESELESFPRKLGDLLLERRFITLRQLDAALARQNAEKRPLGAILIEMGVIYEEDLIGVLGTQLRLTTREIDPYELPLELFELLPRFAATRFSVCPVQILSGGQLLVASNALLSHREVNAIQEAVGRDVEVCLSTRSDIAFAIQRGYRRLEEVQSAIQSRLGHRLVYSGLLTEAQLRQALKRQRRTCMRLGEVLVQEQVLGSKELEMALERYHKTPHSALRFGDFLVQSGMISAHQLEHALFVQRTRFRRLGEVLVEMNLISEERLRIFVPALDEEDSGSRLA